MSAPASPRAGPYPRSAPRLRLESLEDRAVPATFTVNTTLDELTAGDGRLSLREAITRANASPGADVIVLPAGLYRIAISVAGDDANLTGDFDVHGAVTIQGAGAGLTIIDAAQLDRVFDVSGTAPSSIRVVLQGLTIRNGNVSGDGGGIRVANADLVVRDSAVTGNRASGSGGGVSNAGATATGNVTLVRTTVGRNVAGTNGGGLEVLGAGGGGGSTLAVNSSTVRRNVAGGVGGGIYTTTVNLTTSTVSGNSATGSGGGINAATANLTTSTVSGNVAVGGGGGIDAGTANLTGSTVSGNFTISFGGGGVLAGTATVTNSTVSGNSAGGNGGGILATTAAVTRSTVSGNSATANGGGVNATTVNLTGSAVSGNSARSDGGGVQATSTATVTGSTVSGNTATGSGGGINTATANLTNSTVSGNTSTGSGGGGILAVTATLLNCTVAENVGHTGGGGLFHLAGGAFTVKNTIVALNLVDFTGAGPDVSGDFASGGHNLIGDGTGGTGFTNGVGGDIVGTGAKPVDPKLGPLANNGGPTRTRALLAGSPAIDHGDNGVALTTDQRGVGFPRRKDGNGDGVAVVDIGAFER
jgi:predicted outer membrane repeat protein